jgi:hypothetical protein
LAVRLNARLLGALEAVVDQLPEGYAFLIVSGVRSAAEQAALRARWDAGDRRGLSARPALVSAHTRGRAVDLNLAHEDGRIWRQQDTPELWPWLAAELRRYQIRWGGPSDPNHFEL